MPVSPPLRLRAADSLDLYRRLARASRRHRRLYASGNGEATMKRLPLLALALALVQPDAAHAGTRAPKPAPALSVAAAISSCRAHPSSTVRIAVQGWFVPGVTRTGLVQGLLFDSRRAVPLVAVNRWDVNGNWKKYGALLTFITTKSSVGPRKLTLHGVLECATDRFRTDRDPFPAPGLKTVYGASRAGQAATTWAVAGGLKLSLTVPRRTYPRNALAQVTVNLQNVSSRVVGYRVPGVDLPGVTAPQVEVLDSSGRIVFPPAMPFMPPLFGPPATIQPLQPGQTVRANEYIVVRGARIRASEPFASTWSQVVQRPPNELVTRPIGVHLTAETPPKLVLHGPAQDPTIDVVRPQGVSGQMRVLSYADCSYSDGGPRFAYRFGWTPAGPHLLPGCTPVYAWHVRVAWPDHPVAALEYNAPQPATPTPAPTSTPVPTPTSPPGKSGPAFANLLRRADVAMESVHAMHTAGIRTSVDASAGMSLRIQVDCRSETGHGIPIVSHTLVSGRQSQAGKVDEGYVVAGPVVPTPHK